MKKIIYSISFLALATIGLSQPPRIDIQKVKSNATEFNVSIVFEENVKGPVSIDNANIYLFIEKSYTSAKVTSVSGSWISSKILDHVNLSKICDSATKVDYAVWSFSSTSISDLGNIRGESKEILFNITLLGKGKTKIPLIAFDPFGQDPLSMCLKEAGLNNVVSIDLDGKNEPLYTVGHENILCKTYIEHSIPPLNFPQAQDVLDIGVFPNPATNRLSINTSGIEGEMTIQMMDMAGSLVYKTILADDTSIHDIYLDETIFTPGTYFVQLIQHNTVMDVQKVIVINN